MDRKSTTHNQTAAIPLPTRNAPSPGPQAASSSDRRRLRLARIDEYEEQGLKHPNALVACLTGIQADLLRTEVVTGSLLNDALADIDRSPEGMRPVERPFHNQLKVVRQIDRLAQPELRRLEVRQKEKSLARKLARGPLGQTAKGRSASEDATTLSGSSANSSPPGSTPGLADHA